MKQMAKLIALAGLAAASPALANAPAPAAPASAPPGWKMVFAEEFNGTALDADKWTVYEDCWGGGNSERQCYINAPGNLVVHDGQLDLTARFERATGPSLPLDQRKPGVEVPNNTKPFTSGKISTKGHFQFTYGRLEVRAKLPQGQGVWPAIWLLPFEDKYGEWPGSGEIDVMEGVNLGVKCGSCIGGVENNVYGTIHYGSNMHHQWQQNGVQLPKDAVADWHVYRVDWRPDVIEWYLDGKRYARVKLSNWRDTLQRGFTPAPAVAKAPFDRPFYLILNLAIGGVWPESHDQAGVILKDYPKAMGVDWVHIYQCDDPAGCAG